MQARCGLSGVCWAFDASSGWIKFSALRLTSCAVEHGQQGLALCASVECVHTTRWAAARQLLPGLLCCFAQCASVLSSFAGSRDWQRPDKTLRPAGTVALEGGVACETDFSECTEDAECDVEIAGAKVPLQRISVTLPPDMVDVGGMTFVLRRYVRGMGVHLRWAGSRWRTPHADCC